MGLAGRLDAFGLSDRGRVRDVNEDQFLIADLQKSMMIEQTSLSHEDRTRLFGRSQGQLLVVADGMGGLGAGDKASRIAVSSVIRYALNTMDWFFRLAQERTDDLKEELVEALNACQRGLDVVVDEHPEQVDMGTTLTMAYLIWPRMYVVHTGDSRCYLWRDGELAQLTRDHTVAEQLKDKGILGPGEPSRWRNVLYNFIGAGGAKLAPEVSRAELQQGDVVLLCTDGLTRHLKDGAIADILRAGLSSVESCHRLVDAANKAGGRDNITVVVGRTDISQASSSMVLKAIAEKTEPVR